LVQIVGIGLGVLIALSSVFLVRSVDLGGGVIIGGILAGCTVAVLVYGLGTLIAAQGQSLLASLDSVCVFVKRKGNHLTVEKGTTSAIQPAP